MSWDHRRLAVHKVIHSDIHCDIHCPIHRCLRRHTAFGACPHARDWAVILMTAMLAKTSVASYRHEIEQGRHSSWGPNAVLPPFLVLQGAGPVGRNPNVFPVGLKICPATLRQIDPKANHPAVWPVRQLPSIGPGSFFPHAAPPPQHCTLAPTAGRRQSRPQVAFPLREQGQLVGSSIHPVYEMVSDQSRGAPICAAGNAGVLVEREQRRWSGSDGQPMSLALGE